MKTYTFGYWMPGGTTGEIEATSPFNAACEVFGTREITWVRGDSYTQPWHYCCGGDREVKLWKRKEVEL